MKMLSDAQWRMLEDAGTYGGVALDSNMNTMSALFCRSLVDVSVISSTNMTKRLLVPTRMGQMYLDDHQKYDTQPAFRESRTEIKEWRLDESPVR